MTVKPSFGPPRTSKTTMAAFVCAGMMVLMLVAQLYAYDDFATILDSLLPFNDRPLTEALAAAIVLAELLSLPYLLKMYVSKLLRAVSASLAGVVSLSWLIVSLTSAHALNGGLFSTALEVHGGLLPAAWSFVMVATYVWVVAADSKFRHAVAS